MKTFGVIHMKGGSGKTHTVMHLAHEAGRAGRVAVIDLDPTRQAVNWAKLAGLALPAIALDYRVEDLRDYVEQLRESGEVDVVLIDTPANDREVMREVLQVADVAIIPVGVGSSDLGMLGTTESEVKAAQAQRPDLQVAIVINRARFSPNATRETIEQAGLTGFPVLASNVPLRAEYQRAAGNVPRGVHYGEIWRELGALGGAS